MVIFRDSDCSTDSREDPLDSEQIIYGDNVLNFDDSDSALSLRNFEGLDNEKLEDIMVDILYEKMSFKGTLPEKLL